MLGYHYYCWFSPPLFISIIFSLSLFDTMPPLLITISLLLHADAARRFFF